MHKSIMGVALGVALATLGCSDDEPATTASGGTGGTGGGGGAGAQGGNGGSGGDQTDPPDWSCLGSVTIDPPAAAMITYTIAYEDFISGDPLSGLTAKACARTDTLCATPLDEQMSDADGNVTLTVPTGTSGFDGIVEITGDGIAWINVFNYPLTEDIDSREGIITKSGLITLAAVLSTTIDDADGHLLFAVEDCGPGDPTGAVVSATNTDADTVKSYLVDDLPRADATETDPSGFGGFVNMPPGTSTITATVADTDEVIASADVFTRAGFTTFVFLPPTP